GKNKESPVKVYFPTAIPGIWGKTGGRKQGKGFVTMKLQGCSPNLTIIKHPLCYQNSPQTQDFFQTVKSPKTPEKGEGDWKAGCKLSMQTADKFGSKIILANDPDADRLAVAERTESGWRVFTGNEIGALLGWWCWTTWRQKHPSADVSDANMMSSTVSSKILEALAKKEGFKFIETLTGFKWMGNEADRLLKMNKHVLFAFEEAIGFMCGSQVLDKDGIVAAAVVAELASYVYSSSSSLSKQLEVIYETYGYHVSQCSYFICHDEETITAMFNRLRNFDGPGKYPKKCGKFEIAHVRDLTVGYDSETEDKKPTLPTSKSSQMITFKFANGCVATLRTSGTEPKIKYYTEHRPDPEKGLGAEEVKKELEQIVASIEEHFYNIKLFPKILRRQ
ncbi:unnamed protein product, partial [Candidula unifasciata]